MHPIFRLVFGVIVFAGVFLFQNCGVFQSPKSARLGSSSESSPLPTKAEKHGCYSQTYEPDSGYYLGPHPVNSGTLAVFHNRNWLIGVSTPAFVAINSRYGRTATKLFYGARHILDIEPDEVVEVLSPTVLKLQKARKILNDGDHVGLDFDSFAIVNHDVFADKYGYYDSFGGDKVLKTMGAQHLGGGYFSFKSKIYFMSVELKGADPFTFHVKSGTERPLAYDRQSVFYMGSIVNGAIPNTPPQQISNDGAFIWHDGKTIFIYEKILGPLSDLKILSLPWLTHGDKVIYGKTEVVGAKASSFEVINKDYGFDQSNIYYHGTVVALPEGKTFSKAKIQRIGDVILFDGHWLNREIASKHSVQDPASFRCIHFSHYTDGTKVYDSEDFDVTADFLEVDTATLQKYSANSYFDKNKFFFESGSLRFSSLDSFKPINSSFFEANGKIFSVVNKRTSIASGIEAVVGANSNLIIIGNNHYFKDDLATAIPIEGEIKFKNLGENYFQVGQKVMYGNRTLIDADANTFRVLSLDHSYDENSAYFSGNKLADFAKGTPVRLLSNDYFLAVGSQVYYEDQLVIDARPEDFVPLFGNHKFFRSGNSMFCSDIFGSQAISQDHMNFEILDSDYWRDSTRVGHRCTVLPGVNPATARVVGNLLDSGAGIYFQNYLVSGAVSGAIRLFNSPAAVTSSVSGFWTDGLSVYYYNSKLTDADPLSFELLPHKTMLWRDANSLGFLYEVFDTSDPDSAKILVTKNGDLIVDTGTSVYLNEFRVRSAISGQSISVFRFNTIMDSFYWTDSVNVFFDQKQITEVTDVKAFRALGHRSAVYNGECFLGHQKTACP